MQPLKSGFPRLVLLLAALLCLWGGSRELPRTMELREKHQLFARAAREGVPPEYILTSTLLGGFRGIFLTTLWIRAQDMKNEGNFHEMIQIYNVLTKLQPGYPNVWAFIAWDLAFNVSVEFKDDGVDRVFWVFRGIDMLRLQGIPKNPRIPHLAYELAWIFHFKIGEDTDWAHPLYRQYLAQTMNDILNGLRPEDWELYEKISALPTERDKFLAGPGQAAAAAELKKLGLDLIADAGKLLKEPPESAKAFLAVPANLEAVREAGLWEIGRRLRTEAGLDPYRMFQLGLKYGALDWRLPHVHALYWAVFARDSWLESRPAEPSLKYERLIYFSLIKLVERGKLVIAPDGRAFNVPNYAFWDKVIAHMDELLASYRNQIGKSGSEIPLTGVISGYENYLKTAIINGYFDGREAQAAKFLNKLAEIAKAPEQYRVPLRTFVQKELGEWLSSMNKDRAIGLMNIHVSRAYWSLGMGDQRNYEYKLRWAEYVHSYALKRWPQAERKNNDDYDFTNYVPPLAVIKQNALLGILTGQDPTFSPHMAQYLAGQLQALEPALWAKVEKELKVRRDKQNQSQEYKGPLLPEYQTQP